jgi:hypothetical protein
MRGGPRLMRVSQGIVAAPAATSKPSRRPARRNRYSAPLFLRDLALVRLKTSRATAITACSMMSRPLPEVFVGDDQRRQQLEHLVFHAGGLDHQTHARSTWPTPCRPARHLRRRCPESGRVRERWPATGMLVDDGLETLLDQMSALRCDLVAQFIIASSNSSAFVAVMKARLCPRKVPLCSPGDHWSSSGLNMRDAQAADRNRSGTSTGRRYRA